MKCPHHPKNEVVGYCYTCGAFGCAECLTEHEGNLLCARHYRPIAQKIEEEKRHEEMRRKHPRQRLVARFKDGRCLYGVCFALNLKDSGFHLDLVDAKEAHEGKTELIQFRDLKAVFLVKSFDGKFDKSVRYREWTPEGTEMVVEFMDGEVIRGFSLHRYDAAEPRFHLIPSDPATNNISIVVEQSYVENIMTPNEYAARQEAKKQATQETPAAADTSQEETLGDFYFETRNYAAALQQFKLAEAKFPKSRRVKVKVLTAQYNVGVGYIKTHDYGKALAIMEEIHRAEPQNERIRKKVHKLRHIVNKESGQPLSDSELP